MHMQRLHGVAAYCKSELSGELSCACLLLTMCVCQGSWLDGLQEEEEQGDAEGLTCPVCLDVFFSPHSCQPCGHVFCEPCLRTVAKHRATNTPCPLCRSLILHTNYEEGQQINVPKCLSFRYLVDRVLILMSAPFPPLRRETCSWATAGQLFDWWMDSYATEED